MAALAIGVFNYLQLKSNKIAYIDTVRILNNSTEIKRVIEQTELRKKSLQAKADTIFNEFQLELKEMEKRKMSESEVLAVKRNMNLKEMQFKKFAHQTSKDIEQKQVEFTKNVLAKVNSIVTKIAAEEGYNMVFGANGSGNVIYGNEAIDISSVVIKSLNGN